jgi:hypothetical protein
MGGKGNILHSLRQYGAGHMQEGETQGETGNTSRLLLDFRRKSRLSRSNVMSIRGQSGERSDLKYILSPFASCH